MGVWDKDTPAGSDPKSQGDDRIREMKAALEESLRGGEDEGVEAVFPGPDPGTDPVFHYRGRKGATAARPAAGNKGLFFDETRNALQRDNGSAWEDIGTVIPAETKMVVYQATAPIGFMIVPMAGRMLRVDTDNGGVSGGTVDPAAVVTLAHGHTVNSHNHSVPGHIHLIDYDLVTGLAEVHSSVIGGMLTGDLRTMDGLGDNTRIKSSLGGSEWTTDLPRRHYKNRTRSGGDGNTGAAAPGTSTSLANISFAYANVLTVEKT